MDQLLFLSTRGGAVDAFGRPLHDIYRMNADGTGVENLTRNPLFYYWTLSLSPDGRQVAFAGPQCDIWVMNTDGTNLCRLTNRDGGREDGCNASPRWSRDGRRIAFASNRDGRVSGRTRGLYDVFVTNADGSDPRNVSHALGDAMGFNVFGVRWSPDGRVVFHTSGFGNDYTPRVYVVNADGNDPRPFFNSLADHSPHWSPDGSKVAFIGVRDGRGRLYVMNADGSGERALTTHAGVDVLPGLGDGPPTEFERSPWSPDGTRIAFQHEAPNEDGIYVINVDGSGRRRLTTFPGHFNGWSPDGTRIAFTEAANVPGFFHLDVFVINADGSGRVNLTADNPADDSDALWVPGGRTAR